MQFMLFTDMCLIYFTFYGIIAVAITPNLIAAAVISGALYGLFNLFAGAASSLHVPFRPCKTFSSTLKVESLHYARRIFLFAMSIGSKAWQPWVIEEEEALPLLKAAYDRGLTTWDTGA